VVLVDDDSDVLTVLKQNLEANNYQVYAFDNPIKALEYIQSTNSPQLLITDIRMPGMNGFELARQTNSCKPDMMIMLLTSFEINWSEFETVFPSARSTRLSKSQSTLKSWSMQSTRWWLAAMTEPVNSHG